MNFTFCVHLSCNKKKQQIDEKPMSILQTIYQTYLEPRDKGSYHRLYTGFGNNLEELIGTELFSRGQATRARNYLPSFPS